MEDEVKVQEVAPQQPTHVMVPSNLFVVALQTIENATHHRPWAEITMVVNQLRQCGQASMAVEKSKEQEDPPKDPAPAGQGNGNSQPPSPEESD